LHPGKKWWFPCKQWLDAEHGLEKMMVACHSDPRAALVDYKVLLPTMNTHHIIIA
jgi:hypothetical protein